MDRFLTLLGVMMARGGQSLRPIAFVAIVFVAIVFALVVVPQAVWHSLVDAGAVTEAPAYMWREKGAGGDGTETGVVEGAGMLARATKEPLVVEGGRFRDPARDYGRGRPHRRVGIRVDVQPAGNEGATHRRRHRGGVGVAPGDPRRPAVPAVGHGVMTMARPFFLRQAARRAALAAASLLLGATAAEGQGQTPNVRTVLPGFDQPILLDTLALARPISGSREQILAAVNTVLTEWKILIDERDGTAGRTEHVRAEVSRRIGGEPISKYLNCGRGFSGNNADFFRLRLAIAAWPFPLEGEPKELRIATIASGRDPAGSRSTYGPCASNGKLEVRLWERVVELVDGRR